MHERVKYHCHDAAAADFITTAVRLLRQPKMDFHSCTLGKDPFSLSADYCASHCLCARYMLSTIFTIRPSVCPSSFTQLKCVKQRTYYLSIKYKIWKLHHSSFLIQGRWVQAWYEKFAIFDKYLAIYVVNYYGTVNTNRKSCVIFQMVLLLVTLSDWQRLFQLLKNFSG